ncbi:hypothetical protein D9M68_816400 [compost metagenome]
MAVRLVTLPALRVGLALAPTAGAAKAPTDDVARISLQGMMSAASRSLTRPAPDPAAAMAIWPLLPSTRTFTPCAAESVPLPTSAGLAE